MFRIGVIGATGMIGHHVAREVLRQGNELVVIHRRSSNLFNVKELTFTSRTADLNSEEELTKAFQDLDYVLNCGAYYPSKPKPLNQEVDTAREQMRNFIQAVRHSSLKRALYVGAAIALPLSSSGTADEKSVFTDSPKNQTAYVQVKWLMDKMACEAARLGVNVIVGIPGMTFGEYDYAPSTGRLIVNTVNQTLPGYVNGNRNVIYAGDAARGLLLACLKGKVGERYLITGENLTMNEFIDKVLEQSNIHIKPKVVPLMVAKILSKIKMTRYKVLGGKLPLLDETAIAVMSAGQFLNGNKAREELGYESKVSTQKMLEKTIEWFKANGYINR